MIDLRSDTVTVPDAAMRQAMAAAPVGDDVYGEDPGVNTLQEKVADLLGHEAGLFTPSGTMANQVGLAVSVTPGTELLAEQTAHILRAEMGALAAVFGVTTRTWRGERGRIDREAIEAQIAPAYSPFLVSTSAIAVENTHNFGGGTIQHWDDLVGLRHVADKHGLLLHLDGARLWNAHVATGIPLSDYGRLFDTVSVCFSKGLGAPVGSVLVSSRERIAAARVWRKRLGGGMRQVGVLAAAAEHALEHNLADLTTDHDNAQHLARALGGIPAAGVDPTNVDTNIVVLDLGLSPWSAAALGGAAAQRGVAVSVLGPDTARLVTHRDVSTADVERAGEVLVDVLSQEPLGSGGH